MDTMADFEPDNFDELYADELEMLREMEADTAGNEIPSAGVNNKQGNKVTSSITPCTPEPSPHKSQKTKKLCTAIQNGKSRKRGVEELFGTLSSDSEDEQLIIDVPPLSEKSPLAKKLRHDETRPINSQKNSVDDFEITPPPSPDKELETLQRIKTQRDLAQITTEDYTMTTPAPITQKKPSRVLNRQPEGLSITVTGTGGKRVYLRQKEDTLQDTISKNGQPMFASNPGKLRLLRMSILQLRHQLEDEKHEKLIMESKKITESIQSHTTEDDHSEDDEMSPEEQNRNNLWVDRYAPRHFTDLLSDDGVNRNILFWLKLWDTVVFGKEKKQRTKPQEIKNAQPKKFNPNFKRPNAEDLNDELDEHNRPVHPIALLCGPPGLGKTTLAHVIAHQAGYNALEINASDDRSLDVFRNRIESATQMKSVLIKDQKPNCLVIDEIDGAPVPTINFLVNLAKRGDAKTGDNKKKKKLQILQRPIICICNDLYVPALRPLRQISYVSHFPPTLSARLASRMLQISKENSMKIDMTTLMALASKAENDIRSCLNTLQFLHRQGHQVNLSTIHSLAVGQKDQQKGLFVTWQEIFQLPRPKRKQYTNPHDIEAGRASLPQKDRSKDANPASFSARFHRILSLAMTCGEYAKLMQGVFENYLDVKFKDPHLDSISIASDWMIFFDLLNTRIVESQNYIFNRYMPFIPVMFHMLFASVSRPQIKYPSADFESRQKQQKIINHLTTMLTEACPRVKKTLDVTLAVQEVIPLLQIIISPMFRPVSTQLFSMQEKKQLAELVDIMMSFSLTYQQERNKEGQYNYIIDPNLDDITRFSDAPPSRQMTYGTKQLISREIELEKLRRREKALTTPANPNERASKSSEKPSTKSNTASEPAVPRHKQTLAPKAVDTSENKPVKNFFSRFKKIPKKSEPVTADKRVPEKPPEEKLVTGKIWFQFNQGYTNAVRKTVRIQDLL